MLTNARHLCVSWCQYGIQSLRPFWVSTALTLTICLLYRFRLYLALSASDGKIRAMGFYDVHPTLANLIGFMSGDLGLALGTAFGVQVLCTCVGRIRSLLSRRPQSNIDFPLKVCATVIIVGYSLIATAAHRLLLETTQGIDTYLSTYFLSGFITDPVEVGSMLGSWCFPSDVFFYFTTLVLGFLVLRLAAKNVPWFATASVFTLLVILCGVAVDNFRFARLEAMQEKDPNAVILRLDTETLWRWNIRPNPVMLVFRTGWRTLFGEMSELESKEGSPSARQQSSVALVDSPFASQEPQLRWQSLKTGLRDVAIKNVIFVILESAGSLYMLHQEPQVMPFTRSMAESAWYFRNHFTTLGATTPAVSSIFTGLYPGSFNFDQRGWNIPTLFTFLKHSGRTFDQFWVTSGSFRGFFPTDLLSRDGSLEIWDRHNLPFASEEKEENLDWMVDEGKTSEFFLDRAKRAHATGPFIGVYYPYSPHYPYVSSGDPARWLHKDDSKNLNRYLNALHNIDHLIERLIRDLKSAGILDETLVIITGDHGESFGPIPFHGPQLTLDVLQTPLVLYNPKLPHFATDTPTSHVDILPTILDVLDIPYNRELFHGESLIPGSFHRGMIAASNWGEDLLLVDMTGRQMRFLFKKGECEEIAAESEASDHLRAGCQETSELFASGLQFRKYLRELIPEYNRQLRDKGSFYGKSHPLLLNKTRHR